MIYTLLGYFGMNPIRKMETSHDFKDLYKIDSDNPKDKYFQKSTINFHESL